MKVIVLEPIVKLKLGSAPDVVVLVLEGPDVCVGVVVAVVVGVVDVGLLVVVLAAVWDVVVTEGAGPVLEPVVSNISKTISTKRSRRMAPNTTNAHGLRYQGLGGLSGGPGGGPPGGCCPYPPPGGGCCPYPGYSGGCSE